MSLFSRETSHSLKDVYSYWTLLALVVLLPVFVYVFASMSPMITKVTVAGVVVLTACILYAIAHIRSRELSAPRSLLLIVAWLLPVAYGLSTLFGGDRAVSLMGMRPSMDTFAFILIATLTLTLTALLLTSQQRALGTYLALMAGAIAVSVFELVLFFARDMVAGTGAILSSISIIGSLNDLAVFFGLIVIFVLISTLLLPVTKIVRGVLVAVLLLALYFLAVVNLTVLWWILGLFALATLVYSLTTFYFTPTTRKDMSVASLVVVVVCAFFLFSSGDLSGRPAKWADVGELDVRPSWQTTISIGRGALEGHTFFGTGPGTFERVWSARMPTEIQATDFWQTNFAYGIGFIPTSVITTGLVGACAWIIFFAVFLWQGVRSLVLVRADGKNDIAHYLRSTSFVAALYLWIVAFIQVPSPTLLVYAFLFTGVFIASLTFGTDTVKVLKVSFEENQHVGFLATLLLTVMVLLSVGGIYAYLTTFFAEVAYQQAARVINQNGDIDKGEELTQKALNIHPVDAYYRLLSNIDLVRLQKVLQEGKDPEAIRNRVQELLAQSISNANKAVERNEFDYQNWINLGSIYQSIVPLGIEGATDSAIGAFDQALVLRPNAPQVYLAKATIERARGNTEIATDLVKKAISLRNRYTEAIFFLAQLQIEGKDVANALRSVEAVTIFEPQNPVAFFQLGLLQYGSDNFSGAKQSLEKAVALSPVYANARYFLGLSYWRLGDASGAQKEFERVLETNPDNAEVRSIISNLRAGKAPFVSPSPASDIQGREGLPLEENGVASTTPKVLGSDNTLTP